MCQISVRNVIIPRTRTRIRGTCWPSGGRQKCFPSAKMELHTFPTKEFYVFSFMTVPPNYPSFSETHFCFVCTFKASIVIF